MKEENYRAISEFERDNWWYRAKRNIFSRIFRRYSGKVEKSLDLGCGSGSNFGVLRKFSNNVVGIDYSESALGFCKSKGYSELAKMNAESLRFKENYFDLVLCSDVLEHVDDKKAVKEIARVLKRGGLFVFSVPAHNYLWGPTDVISEHKKRYEKEDFKELLEKDFRVLKLGYWNFSFFIPNLIFLKILSLLGKDNKPDNTLHFIPKFLNDLIYLWMSLENKIFMSFGLPQGVSIIGICKKK